MKRTFKITLLFTEILLTYLILIKQINIPCASKKLFNLACPACGLTRAFKSILSLKIYECINYNLLGVPIFIFITLLTIYLIYDIITNNKKTEKLFNTLGKHYILIMITLIINGIINNIKGI
jgi:hypothetical protein